MTRQTRCRQASTIGRFGIVLLSALIGSACAALTEPSGNESSVARAEPNAPPSAAPPGPPMPPPTPPPAPTAERVTASHILVSFRGALRAEGKRSKKEAKQRAQALLGRIKKGEDFAKLADEYTDDPSGKSRGGSLGAFDRTGMVKPFSDAAFALKPGEVSPVIETEFGFHVIKRAP